jgi:DNA invertase Pin-like site-specific DNA recombinase
MATIAYLRVSKDTQDVKNQRLAILEFARREQFEVDSFIEIAASSRRSAEEQKIELLFERLSPSDTLIVSELSRLGRSVGEIITTIDSLIKEKVRLLAVREGIRRNGKHDLQIKVMVSMSGLFADIERELISMRTKEALAAAKASGRTLGRPTVSWGGRNSTAERKRLKVSWN